MESKTIRNSIIGILAIIIFAGMIYYNNQTKPVMLNDALSSVEQKKEDAVVVIANPSCIHCRNFHQVTKQYQSDPNFKIYTVQNTSTWGSDKNSELIAKTYPTYTETTPTTYYYDSGKILLQSSMTSTLEQKLTTQGLYKATKPEDPIMIVGAMDKETFDTVLLELKIGK